MSESQASSGESMLRLDPQQGIPLSLKPLSKELRPKDVPDLLLKHKWLLKCLMESPDQETASLEMPLSESDWVGVVGLATRHGVVPLLYQRVTSRATPVTVPDRVLHTLRESFLMNGTKNALLYRDLAQLLTALRQNNIPVIVLKGGHLAALVYDNPAVRMMNDVDLLVRRNDLARAASILRDLGYAPEGSEADAAWGEKCQHLPRLFKPPGAGIELHWLIASPTLPFKIDTAALWERARPAVIAGIAAQVLSPEDLLLYLCAHTASHGLRSLHLEHAPFRLGLRPLCDIAATLQRHKNEINWQQVQSRATEWRVGKCVYLSLWLVKELLRVDVPASILESFCPRDFAQRWCNLALDQVAMAGADPIPPEPVKSVLLPFMKLGGGSVSGARLGKLGLLVRAAFPPREAMAEYMSKHHSLPLNPVRNYSCYLTRAIDWLPRLARLAWYGATHRRQAAFYAREIRQPLLWKWLTDVETKDRYSNR